MLVFVENGMASIAPEKAVLLAKLSLLETELAPRQGLPQCNLVGPTSINLTSGEFAFSSTHAAFVHYLF
ncbi:hypothetical protein SAMN03159496_04606 [Rhizobium sp. NFR07]|uniref:hypothetical protein n=1 Tax=Rhizobium sp. NFR07 TaxID=1566262 RepID=UPI0008DEEB8E|nr:hypothetical protein [Rhizobium sp. NFR07]SFB52129.1 hypothetical protein SAMN03159496_04606 [Rhizobium sp. NFR07]